MPCLIYWGVELEASGARHAIFPPNGITTVSPILISKWSITPSMASSRRSPPGPEDRAMNLMVTTVGLVTASAFSAY